MVKIRWLGDLVSGWDTCWIKSGVVSGLSIASDVDDVDEGCLNCWSSGQWLGFSLVPA